MEIHLFVRWCLYIEVTYSDGPYVTSLDFEFIDSSKLHDIEIGCSSTIICRVEFIWKNVKLPLHFK